MVSGLVVGVLYTLCLYWKMVFFTLFYPYFRYYEVKINQDYKNLKFVGHDNSFKHQIKGHVRYSSTCITSCIIVLEWVMHVDIRDMIHLLELIVTDSQFPTLMERLVTIQRNTHMPPHSVILYTI